MTRRSRSFSSVWAAEDVAPLLPVSGPAEGEKLDDSSNGRSKFLVSRLWTGTNPSRRRVPIKRLVLVLSGLLAIALLVTSSALGGSEEFELDAEPAMYNKAGLAEAAAWRASMSSLEQPAAAVQRLDWEASFDRAHQSCLSRWVANGELCAGLDLSSFGRIDGIWTWVNGSDTRHVLQRNATVAELMRDESWAAANKPILESINDNGRFREHNELLYSIRSAFKHLGTGIGKVHLLTTDFLLTPEAMKTVEVQTQTKTSSGTSNRLLKTASTALDMWRGLRSQAHPSEVSRALITSNRDEQVSDVFFDEFLRARDGQVPQWLNLSHATVASGNQVFSTSSEEQLKRFRVHHHWSSLCQTRAELSSTIRRDPSTRGELDIALADDRTSISTDQIEQYACRVKRLQTYNSNVIDSMLGDQPGLSDTFFYSNDDTFFGNDMSIGDLATPLYGPIFRFETETVAPNFDAPNQGGEWASLHYSSALISERFGYRGRWYQAHQHKVFVGPVFREAKVTWRRQLQDSQLSKFRAKKDLNAAFINSQYHIERHREALLWAYLVARMDTDGDGFYSPSEWQALLEELGASAHTEAKVTYPKRTTLQSTTGEDTYSRNLFTTGLNGAKAASIAFTSADGYPMVGFEQRNNVKTPLPEYDPSRWQKSKSMVACRIAPICFAPFVERAKNESINVNDVFKRLAFEHWGCGDCILLSRLQQSGESGLSGFLPSDSATMPGDVNALAGSAGVAPHLPLVDNFHHASFLLKDVTAATRWAGRSRRDFATRLIARYNYAITVSDGPIAIQALSDANSTDHSLAQIDAKNPSLFCLNDNIHHDEAYIADKLGKWFSEKYPEALQFERGSSA
ncbi:hypothetical protein IE81DRAFT_346522 [Ceraceosorus guamensis]|uniref:EF-hand domain-containing protein n=1 Tax=Ceraceosorus guamensis TaxID=1522189 RepID=A0A316W147_9BASI|nr:hypothetical protein IE81DRAFT_346522 [Ceraceosorus guamensis]PWN43530.1 hypothetical protein IE81DRAFT_346522 [Ceraceosorus guamensis]